MDGANLVRLDKKDNPRETTHCRARRSPKAPAAPYLKGPRGLGLARGGIGAGTRGGDLKVKCHEIKLKQLKK